MKRKGLRLNIFVCIVSLLFTLFLSEHFLGLSGFETGEEQYLAYQPFLRQQVKAIDHFYEHSTNSQGIRYREIPLEKSSPDEARVAIIGDSFVDGTGVEDWDRFSSVLERKFSVGHRNFFFISCGASGFGLSDYWDLLKGIALKYHPDRVTLVFYANDVFDTRLIDDYPLPTPRRRWLKQVFRDFFPKWYFLTREACNRLRPGAIHHGVVRDSVDKARAQGIPEDKIKQWVNSLPSRVVRAIDGDWVGNFLIDAGLLEPNYWIQSLDLTGDEMEMKWRQATRLLGRMVRVCRNENIPMYLVYAPSPHQYDPDYDKLSEKLGLVVRKEWLTEKSELERRLENWTEAQAVPFLNLTPYFREEQKRSTRPLNFKVDPHWTPRGHWLVAMVIERWLKENKFLS